ncbi:sodium/hydrogen exchanger family protein [Burkholderia cepacia]|nr:sodium/hydrogen exchanger family protein [Burkholderia cepacia]
MPHDISLIALLAAGFGLAMVFGYFASLLKMPPLVGYLLAGIVIGPGTPGFVGDLSLAQQLAEVGVMLLMFGVGLHFSLGDLLAVRKIALPGPSSRSRWPRCSAAASRSPGAGASVRRSCSGSRCRWRVPSCCCVRWKGAGSSRRSTGASRSAGSSSRIS